MMADDELSPKIFSLFTAEAREAVQAIIDYCLLLEQKPDTEKHDDLLADIMREAHKLKGSARSLGLDDIAVIIHNLESVFQHIKSLNKVPDSEVFDLIYQALDGIKNLIAGASPIDISIGQLLERLKMTAADNDALVKAAASQLTVDDLPQAGFNMSGDQETIRITVERLDIIYNLVNELKIAQLNMERNLAVMRSLLFDTKPQVNRMNELLLARPQFIDLYRNSEASYRSMNQLVSQLHDHVRRSRMLPLANVFGSFPRMARDLARQSGKKVTLFIEGGEIELDRSVLEQIKAPLQHLLSNAIDHGVETPKERRAAGKSENGNITIQATQEGSSIHIEIQDDGAGIDLARVKAHAVRSGLLAEKEASQLDEQAVIWFLFQPGFSMASSLTTVSGRGIGLDIVRQSIEAMQGEIQVVNNPGRGVSFLLRVPVSLATRLCLLVQASGQIFALPAINVLYMARVLPGSVVRQNNQLLLMGPEAEPVPAIILAQLFHPEHQVIDRKSESAVYLGSQDQPVVVLVEELCDIQEFVIKELPLHFAQVPWISGAAISGSGEVILVLNPTDLAREVGQLQTEKDV
jgi:two-component system, chemotaxis family, sensor kinase CheA